MNNAQEWWMAKWPKTDLECICFKVVLGNASYIRRANVLLSDHFTTTFHKEHWTLKNISEAKLDWWLVQSNSSYSKVMLSSCKYVNQTQGSQVYYSKNCYGSMKHCAKYVLVTNHIVYDKALIFICDSLDIVLNILGSYFLIFRCYIMCIWFPRKRVYFDGCSIC